jgi:hypothetical protein
MEMKDYKNHRIQREILLTEDALYIKDRAENLEMLSHLHSTHEIEINSSAPISRCRASYAPEYGLLQTIHHYTATGSRIELTLPLT